MQCLVTSLYAIVNVGDVSTSDLCIQNYIVEKCLHLFLITLFRFAVVLYKVAMVE